jgi:hypothetical protein
MKKIFFLLFILLGTFSQAQVNVVGYIQTNGVANYPTHIDSMGKGGYIVAANNTERDAIPCLRRKYGMAVYVQADNKLYILRDYGCNNSWSEFTGGSGGKGTLQDVLDAGHDLRYEWNFQGTQSGGLIIDTFLRNINAFGRKAAFYAKAGDVNAFGDSAAFYYGGDEANNGFLNAFGRLAGAYSVGADLNAFGPGALYHNGVTIGDQTYGNYVVGFGKFSAAYNTGNAVNALGEVAADHNSGNVVNALGVGAALHNAGNYVNALGVGAAAYNAGNNVNALGVDALDSNQFENANAFGYKAGRKNEGRYVNFLGYQAGNLNTGSGVNAFGNRAGQGNNFYSVNLFGEDAQATNNNQTVFAKNINTQAIIDFNSLDSIRTYRLPNKSGYLVVADSSQTIDYSCVDSSQKIKMPNVSGYLMVADTFQTIEYNSLPPESINSNRLDTLKSIGNYKVISGTNKYGITLTLPDPANFCNTAGQRLIIVNATPTDVGGANDAANVSIDNSLYPTYYSGTDVLIEKLQIGATYEFISDGTAWRSVNNCPAIFQYINIADSSYNYNVRYSGSYLIVNNDATSCNANFPKAENMLGSEITIYYTSGYYYPLNLSPNDKVKNPDGSYVYSISPQTILKLIAMPSGWIKTN